jgi:quinolinate synthetase A
VAGLVPEKIFLFNEGFCPIHQQITREDVEKAKALHPHARVAAHPECDQEVLALADYIGSTSGIIDYATSSGGEELIVCTETGVFHEIWKKAGHKRLIAPRADQICPDMKKNTLMKVLEALVHMEPEVELPESIREEALRPLERMLRLAQEGSHEKQ